VKKEEPVVEKKPFAMDFDAIVRALKKKGGP
jgi:hypothetical protein